MRSKWTLQDCDDTGSQGRTFALVTHLMFAASLTPPPPLLRSSSLTPPRLHAWCCWCLWCASSYALLAKSCRAFERTQESVEYACKDQRSKRSAGQATFRTVSNRYIVTEPLVNKQSTTVASCVQERNSSSFSAAPNSAS